MALQIPENTVLLLIDIQQGFDDPRLGSRNNPIAEQNISRLLDAWRAASRPIIHVQHMSTEPTSPFRPGQSGNALKDFARPLSGEPLVQKTVNSAFIGTDLEARLRAAGSPALLVVGLTTDHCVSTTIRMAGNLGFKVFVVADATATFDRRGYDGRVILAEELHQCALASLHGEFATVVETAEVLGALQRTARTA